MPLIYIVWLIWAGGANAYWEQGKAERGSTWRLVFDSVFWPWDLGRRIVCTNMLWRDRL